MVVFCVVKEQAMEASEKLTIQALKAHDKVHPKFKSAGKSLQQKSRASLLSSPEDLSEVMYPYSCFITILFALT